MNWGRHGATGLKEEAEYSIHLESFKEIVSSLLAFCLYCYPSSSPIFARNKQILKLGQCAKCLNKTWVLILCLIRYTAKISIFIFMGYLFNYITMLLENVTARTYKITINPYTVH